MSAVTVHPHQQQLGAALGALASGVYIITAQHNGEQAGMIASWVMQAGFEPPALTVAMAPGRHVADLIQKSGRFTVNVLADKQYALMKPFGKATDNPFEQLDIQESQCGIILKSAAAWLDCVVLDRMHGSTDHDILLAQVVSGARPNGHVLPMTHTRPSGFHY